MTVLSTNINQGDAIHLQINICASKIVNKFIEPA